MNTGETLSTAVRSLIEEATGSIVAGSQQICQGRNSRVDLIALGNGQRCVLKRYDAMSDVQRDRLGTEFKAFSLLRENGINSVPVPLLMDRGHQLGLYEYIAGERPGPASPTDVEAMLAFMGRLVDLGGSEAVRCVSIPNASEACFSLKEFEISLQRRMACLDGEANAASMGKNLPEFLAHLRNVADAWIGEAYHRLKASDRSLPMGERILSPSDFGLHNAVRRYTGELAFLDFEYFGWDDPAKLMADTALHPAMALSDALGKRFAQGLLGLVARSDPKKRAGLSQRAAAFFPLWGCKWCCILLNEFLAKERQRRFFSGAENDRAHNRNAILARQLAKAQTMLDKIRTDNAMARWLEGRVQ